MRHTYISIIFQSTLPARGATRLTRAGSGTGRFQSTLPARGATRNAGLYYRGCNISIHAPRTGSDGIGDIIHARRKISIHAPRTGSDRPCGQMRGRRVRDFNPRSPHGERRATDAYRSAFWTFQSTLPARGATSFGGVQWSSTRFQSTLPARGATPSSAFSMPQSGISIHAPRTGSDLCALAVIVRLVISIHAPRTGSDRTRCSSPTTRRYFNPRSPHGERLVVRAAKPMPKNFNPRSPHGERRMTLCVRRWTTLFQSTLPARGATCSRTGWLPYTPISIHAPRTGSDRPGRSSPP